MKKHKQVGRKSRCTPQLQKQFCDALAKAHTIKNACVVAGISESAFYSWLAKGMSGEEPYAKFVELVQDARARGMVALVESIITDKDWRAKAWYLERVWSQDFGPVAHRVFVRESATTISPGTANSRNRKIRRSGSSL
jgi:transposase